MESHVEDADNTEASSTRQHAKRRQPSFRRQQRDLVTDELSREPITDDKALRRAGTRRCERIEAAVKDCGSDFSDLHLKIGLDPLDGDERLTRISRRQSLAQNNGRHAGNPRQLTESLKVTLIIGHAYLAELPDVDVRCRADDPIAQFLLQSSHQSERDEQRHHAHCHADSRND